MDRYAWLPCLHAHSRHHNLASPADSEGSLCISDAIYWVRPVSDSHVGLSLASVLQVAQLARPPFWTRYIDKFSWVPVSYSCSTLRVGVLLVSQGTTRSAQGDRSMQRYDFQYLKIYRTMSASTWTGNLQGVRALAHRLYCSCKLSANTHASECRC